MNKAKTARDGLPGGSAAKRGRQPEKNLVSTVPSFLVRLVGWQRIKPALREGALRYRHD